jgi:hypothetical protein
MYLTHPCSCITPPHLLQHLLQSDNATVRNAAMTTLVGSSGMRAVRKFRPTLVGLTAPEER